MLVAALKTEAAGHVERHRHERDDEGRALVVHNGRSQGRKLYFGLGVGSYGRRGLTIASAMSKASAGASPAASCRPPFNVRPTSAEVLPVPRQHKLDRMMWLNQHATGQGCSRYVSSRDACFDYMMKKKSWPRSSSTSRPA